MARLPIGESVQLPVRVPAPLLRKLDELAREQRVTRSQLIRAALLTLAHPSAVDPSRRRGGQKLEGRC